MSFQNLNINPNVLKWARESAHLGLNEIPKTTISVEKLIQIESGNVLPTFVQLQKLAKKYERPIGVLLKDKIPDDDYPVIPFFRKENKTDYDSALTLYIRDIVDKQDWARNYLISEGYEPLEFIDSVRLEENTKDVANKILDNINLPTYSLFRKNTEYLKALKNCLEEHNIFVSITGSNQSNKSISIGQAQGFSIVDNYAPFVFVNTKNTTNAKIFTLIHEVVHLFLNESGISENPIWYRKPECREDEIENFCNVVTAEILLPEGSFINEFSQMKGTIDEIISNLARIFLVSELAVCVRLWKLDLIEYNIYTDVYNRINKRIQDYLKEVGRKQKSGGGDYYRNMWSKNGELFSLLAFSAYKSGDILSRDLGSMLKIKTNNIESYFSAV